MFGTQLARDLVWFTTIVATVCLTWFSRPAYHNSGLRNDMVPWLPHQMKGMMQEKLLLPPSLTIAIISNNREASLRRLCDSLLKADHTAANDFFSRIDIIFNLEASSSDSVVAFARNFRWPHGSKTVRKRILQGGLIRAVAESWYPSSRKDYGCILEDDIEVSPHYLSWITKVLVALQRAPDPRVVGISLYSPRITETTNPKRPFDSTQLMIELLGRGPRNESPYMMQTPCSWGAVFFPDHWHEFLGYLNLRYAQGDSPPVSDVQIPGSRTNGWKRSWKKFHFELLYLRGQYLVYPNFHGQKSLSTNHLEIGEHITHKQRDKEDMKADFQVPLLQDGKPLSRLQISDLSGVPVLDLFGEPWLRTEELMRTLQQMALDPYNLDKKYLSTRKEQAAFLLSGNSISSSAGSFLKSDSDQIANANGNGSITFHYGVPQSDGQFAIYRNIQDNKIDESMVKVVWHTGTFVGENNDCNGAPCFSYRLSLTVSGSLRMEQINMEKQNKQGPVLLWASPPDIIPGSSKMSYLAKVERDGRLVSPRICVRK